MYGMKNGYIFLWKSIMKKNILNILNYEWGKKKTTYNNRGGSGGLMDWNEFGTVKENVYV